MSVTPPVIVRRSVRFEVGLRAMLCVSAEHGAFVRLSQQAGIREGWIETDLVDFSAGGFGVMSQVFVPRKTMVTVRIMRPAPENTLMAEVTGRVQRVFMTDRRPAYMVGISFEGLTPLAQRQVDAMLAELAGSEPAVGLPGGPGAAGGTTNGAKE